VSEAGASSPCPDSAAALNGAVELSARSGVREVGPGRIVILRPLWTVVFVRDPLEGPHRGDLAHHAAADAITRAPNSAGLNVVQRRVAADLVVEDLDVLNSSASARRVIGESRSPSSALSVLNQPPLNRVVEAVSPPTHAAGESTGHQRFA